jgi:hypothetical protein
VAKTSGLEFYRVNHFKTTLEQTIFGVLGAKVLVILGVLGALGVLGGSALMTLGMEGTVSGYLRLVS